MCEYARKTLKKNTTIIKTVIRPEGILIKKQGVPGRVDEKRSSLSKIFCSKHTAEPIFKAEKKSSYTCLCHDNVVVYCMSTDIGIPA